MQNSLRCPKDDAQLTEVVGSNGIVECPTCGRAYTPTLGGVQEVATPIEWRFMPNFLKDAFAHTDASVGKIESSSTGLIDRLEHVEQLLATMEQRATDPAAKADLAQLRQDIAGAVSAGQGAQAATRVLQGQLGDLRRSLEELNLGSLRIQVDTIETLLRKHLQDHKDRNV